MGKDNWDARERAEEFYVIDGLTYEQVAEQVSASTSAVQKWGADDDWAARRREYREAVGAIRRNTMLLRARLVKQALKSLEPQHVYAFAALEKAAAGQAIEDPAATTGAPVREIHTAQEAVEALQEAIDLKLNAMLSRPGEISLAAIRDMKKVLELLEELKAKYKAEPEEAKRRGLSDETVEDIKRRILGIS